MVVGLIEDTDPNPANVLVATRILPRGSTRRRVLARKIAAPATGAGASVA